jgi:hypothetical protein
LLSCFFLLPFLLHNLLVHNLLLHNLLLHNLVHSPSLRGMGLARPHQAAAGGEGHHLAVLVFAGVFQGHDALARA